MLEKIYLEITNICNLDCSFCHKTKREKRLMSVGEFDALTDKLLGRAHFLYLHLMGEPLLHPHVGNFITIAKKKGFTPIITTNGSLLRARGEAILSDPPHKVSISLHARGANGNSMQSNVKKGAEGACESALEDSYWEDCIAFARQAANKGVFVALRLWNLGSDADNSDVLERLHEAFPDEWAPLRRGNSRRLSDRIFLEWGEQFDWPDMGTVACGEDSDRFCYGLRDQIGVLCDGTVVPCCLDADGILSLGNLFECSLEEILASPLAKDIYDGFTHRRATQPLCRRCGYAERFSRKKS